MYKLTERRLDAAEALLEDARASLIEHGSFNTSILERDLRQSWDIGYQELKDVMIDMANRFPRFKFVAIYYMENSNPTGVVSEFQDTLASEYGMRHYDRTEIDSLKQQYWKTARSEMQMA